MQEEEQRSNNMLQRMRRGEANEDGRAGGEILVERDRRREVFMPFSPPDHPPCLCCFAQGFSGRIAVP
jgi:hypothetical protein